MNTSVRVMIGVALLAAACKRDAPPAPVPPPPASGAAAAGVQGTPSVGAPVPDFPIDTVPQGPVPKTSPVLEKFLASAPHQKIVGLVVPMLRLMDAGQCAKAVEKARELSEAMRAAGAEFTLSMDVKAMAKKIQDDPNFMDRPYMNYKSILAGLSVGIELAPLTVQLSAKAPAAQKKACDGFAKLLRDIRTGSAKAPAGDGDAGAR